MKKKQLLVKKICFVFIIICILFLVSLILGTDTMYKPLPPTHLNYQGSVQAINKKLPIMLDKETRFDSIALKGKTLYFQYTLINKVVAKIDVQRLRSLLRKEVLKTYCSKNDTMRLFRDNGYSARYTYLDKDFKEILTTTMIPQDCF